MNSKYVAYVGSYTRGEGKGIYMYDVDGTYGGFALRGCLEINNPSYLTISHDGNFLYSNCDEGVASFKILEDGNLELINKMQVNGLRPCYLSTDKKNRYLVTAGYHDGKLTVLRLNKDGSIGPVTDNVFMKSIGSVVGRNYRCHVNCALFSPDEKYILAVDLGADQVKIYSFNHVTGKIKLKDILRCELESGPKHMVFSKNGKFAYLTHENKNYVTVYAYDEKNVAFKKLQTISTLPEKCSVYNSAVTLKLSDDEKHLFVTNSGDNSVAIYANDPETGALDKKCVLPVSGDYPRDIMLFPDGQHFACTNQESDSITVFKVNYDNDYIVMDGNPLKVPSPTCIKFRKLSK